MGVVFINIKSSFLKRIQRVFIALLLSLCITPIITPLQVHAATCPNGHGDSWWECPYNFYTYFDISRNRIAYYDLTGNDGSFFFSQVGTARSTNADYYGTIGFNFNVSYNGKTYYAAMNLDDFTKYQDEVVSGKKYTLWRVHYPRLIDSLKHYNPGVDFNFLYNRDFDSRFIFNALVSRYINGVAKGSVDYYGANHRGEVITGPADANWPYYVNTPERNELYNIIGVISRDQKPQLSAPNTYSIFAPPGATGYQSTTHYKVNGKEEYWVNTKDNFSIYTQASILKSQYGDVFPDYQYLWLDKKNSEDVKIYSYVGSDRWLVHSSYANNFQNTSTSFWHSSNSDSNYLLGHTRMRATQDGQTYYLLSASVKSGQSSGYKDSGQVLKTDGFSPTTTQEQSSKLNDVNSLYIQQKNIYDKGSGLVSSSPYAYVYMKDSSDKGDRIPLSKSAQYSDYSTTLNIAKHLGGKYGDMIIEVWAKDNVNNEGLVTSKTINRPYPSPIATDIEIKDYDYMDSTTKWVRANKEFLLYQRGYSTAMNPTGSQISINESIGSADDAVVFKSSMGIDKYWYMPGNTDKLYRSTHSYLFFNSDGEKKYGTGNHYMKARADLNGRKFYVWGLTEVTTGGTLYPSPWIKESKMLGIDAVGPIIEYTKTGRDEVTLAVRDNESGLKKTVITRKNGTTEESTSGSIVVDLKNSTSTKVVATDNVGNTSTITIGDIKTKVNSSITTSVATINNRKQLVVKVIGNVINPIPGKVMTWNLRGSGDGVKFIEKDLIHTSTGAAYSYTFMIDDIYNQSFGPGLNYNSDGVTYSYIDLNRISDLEKFYSFKLEEKYDFEGTWVKEASKSTTFASGEKDYSYKIYKTTEGLYDTLPSPKLVKEGRTTSSVDVGSLEVGNYYIEMYMFDFNDNPSGLTRLYFKHIQPLTSIDIGVEITAIKDIAWEKEVYPIKVDPSKSPVGIKYKFDGNSIKLGYAVNYSIWSPREHYNTVISDIDYTIKDESGNNLIGYSNGMTFEDNDRKNGTGYLHQLNNIFISKGRFWFKHYLPADATFETLNGKPYEGNVVVSARFKIEEQGKVVYRDIVLYGVTTESTALDDLQLDKQR